MLLFALIEEGQSEAICLDVPSYQFVPSNLPNGTNFFGLHPGYRLPGIKPSTEGARTDKFGTNALTELE